MALDKARAEDTPFPPPDISSPRSNLENLSFNCPIAARKRTVKRREICREEEDMMELTYNLGAAFPWLHNQR